MDDELRRVVDALPGLVSVTLSDGRAEFLNQRWYEYTGVRNDADAGMGWQAVVHPEDLPGLLQCLQSAAPSSDPAEVEARVRRFDGVYRQFIFRLRPLTPASWCGVGVDVEDRRQRDAESRLAGEKQLLELVASARSLSEILDATCHLVESTFARCFCSIILVDESGTRLKEAAAPSLPPSFLSFIILESVSVETEPSAMACCVNDQVIVGDLGSETRWPEWRARARSHGLHACWSTPISSVSGKALGALGIYHDAPRWPTAVQRSLTDQFAAIVRIALERVQNDAAVAQRRRVENQLAGENRLLQMVASGFPLSDVLASLCLFVEDAAPECICGTYLIDWTVPAFRKGAAPSLVADFLDAVEGLPVRAELCPCGVAALYKRQVIAEDLASDPVWRDTPYRDLLLTHGLQSVWSTPILSLSGSVLATFAIYHRQAAAPSAQVQELIAQVTHIASIAIERAQDEASLKRSEAFLAQGQHLSSTGSFAWRVATGEVTFSEQLSRIFEFDRGDRVTLAQVASRLHPEDLPLFMGQVEVARLTGQNIDNELRLRMPDNSVKYVRTIAHASRDENEHVEYIGAVQDVTARRISEQALERARSELAHVARVTTIGALTASIAHEVNQPLSGIITNASTCLRMLAADPPDIEGARETARRTIRDGNRAAEVITRLRALFTKKDFTMEPVDVNEAIREVIALSASELQRNRVVLHQDFADDLPVLFADRVQLQQVILNLLLNAAEAMNGIDDRQRRLVISTKRDESDHVSVAVRDVGVGLERHTVDRMFDAFYTTKKGGMGIGLSVSRSIVERHQGRLWAEPNDGPGTTFSLSIPLDQAGVANAAQVIRSV